MKTIISKGGILLLFLLLSQTIYSQVNGHNATLVEYATGHFKQTSVKTWTEYSSSGNQYKFNERSRDDWSIYLIDKNRNISIQLDLHQKAIYINYDRRNRAKIYSITNSSIVRVPISNSTPRPTNNNIGPQGYTKCANEGGRYNFTKNVDVAYGAKGRFIYKTNVRGTILFSNNTFGDPIPNTAKFGYYKKSSNPRPTNNNLGPQGYTKCANEGGRYNFTKNVDVAYGAKGRFIYKTNVRGTILFSNNTFGDPIPNTAKFGYYKKSSNPRPTNNNLGPQGYTKCANEGGRYNFTKNVDVAYGAKGRFIYKTNVRGTILFSNNTFGDPIPNTAKFGYYKKSSNPWPTNNNIGPQGYTKCANEGGRYNFTKNVDVAYGAKGRFIYKTNVRGTILFSNNTFGDPIPNTAKFGYYKKSSNPRPAPNVPTNTINPISTSDMNIIMSWIAGEVANSKTEYCYKESYGRGVGSPLSKCPRGSEKNGLLCYPKCKSGYYGVGPVCWQKCPKKFRNDGAYCAKPKPYGRGTGYPWKIGDKLLSLNAARARCLRANPQGCRKSGEIIYPKCKSGYKAVGCCICSPICPSGMPDIGGSCQKKSYGRTAGKPMVCASGKENDASLCYRRCKPGYKGVGPVCWKRCPKNQPVNCGAGCAKSTADCIEKTASQVTAVAELAANIMSLGATSKFSAAKAGLKTAIKAGDKIAAKAALKTAVKELANGFEQLTTRLVARKIKEKFKKESAEWVVQEYAKVQMKLVMQEEFSTEDLRDLAGLDPTGIAGVVEAFWQPICSDPKPFPRLSRNYFR